MARRSGRIRNSLAPEAQRAAQRLRLIWDAKRGILRLTQQQVAHMCGWGTQGSFSQYLLGRIPLGLEALLKISGVLHVRPDEIYPELAALLPSLTLPESRLTPRQREIVNMLDSLTEEQEEQVYQAIKQTRDHNEGIFRTLSKRSPNKLCLSQFLDDLESPQ